MNFIESIFNSISKGIKQAKGEYPNEIKTFCIGSGSNFVIHQYISINKALALYKKYKETLQLGTKISKKEFGVTILESFNTMESTTGTTYTFMFPINDVIIHNPNDIIDEWIETDKKHKNFMQDLLKQFTEENKK